MKVRYRIWLGLAATCAIMMPMSAFAEDQKKEAKRLAKSETGGPRHGATVAAPATTRIAEPSGGRSHAGSVRSVTAPATVQRSGVSSYTSQRHQPVSRVDGDRRSQARVYSSQHRYSRSNNYGGLWFPATTHRDWDRNRVHSWNRHSYRWYDGGWLIIDAGFSPHYANEVYSSGGVSVRDVQVGLANRGYYRGAIDGDIGPRTRAAIVGYQGDHDLMVTGRINDALIRSLRL